jgi:hypothetical protein
MVVVDVSNILVAEHSPINLLRIKVETYGELQLLLDDLINFVKLFDNLRAIWRSTAFVFTFILRWSFFLL